MNFPEISKVQTTSGWTLLHCEQRHLPLTSLRIVIGGGTLSDNPKALGTAKMADQLLERHLRQRLRDFRFPSELDLSCDISHSVISLDCLSEDMPRCIEFLGRERHTFQLEKETILRQQAFNTSMVISNSRLDRNILATPSFQVDGVFNSDMAIRTMAAQGLNVDGYRQLLTQNMLVSQMASAYTNSNFVTESELSKFAECSEP